VAGAADAGNEGCGTRHCPPVTRRHNNQTATIAWSTIWSVYTPALPYGYNGLMSAYSPWSGNYDVSPPIWTSAQVTQVGA